jgi:hypothetical protein
MTEEMPKAIDEQKTPEIPHVEPAKAGLEQQKADATEIIEGLQFYASPIRFNSVLFQGFKLMLTKLIALEERLTKIEGKLDERKNTI